MNFELTTGKLAFQTAVKSIRSKERVVVIGPKQEKEMVEEQIEFMGLTPESTLKAARKISAPVWFKKGIKKYVTDDDLGEWPSRVHSKKDWSLDRDVLSHMVHKQVFIAKVNVAESWQIPAEFSCGSGGDYPSPDEHCAIWKYWETRFDAHIVGLSHDIIEAKVFSPPSSKEQAIELAKEQYVYCSDIVSQGCGSVTNLAAVLIGADKWYFWWD